jgi:tetratricopeptide (TPR) repeat protein
MELQQKSYEAVRKTGDKRIYYSICNNIAVNLLWQGKFNEADHYLEKGNAMRVEKDNSLRQLFNLNKAEVLLKKHQYRHALESLLKAYKLIKRTNTSELLSDYYEIAGNCYLQLSEYATAEIYCRKLHENAVALPQKRYIGRSYLLRARIFARKQNSEKARFFFRKTLHFYSRSGHQLEYSETLLQYGRFWMAQGDTANAGKNLKKALSNFRKLDLENYIKRAYLDLCKLQKMKVRPDFKVLTEGERFFRKWDFQKELKALQDVRNQINRKKSDREKHLWKIFEVTQAMCRFDDLDMLSEEIVGQINKLFSTDRCILVIPGASGIEIKTAGNLDPDIIAVLSKNRSSGEESKQFRLDTKMDGFQSIPLILDDRILGVIYIASTIRAYHMKNLKVFARLAAVAIQNALTRENLMRENVMLRNR